MAATSVKNWSSESRENKGGKSISGLPKFSVVECDRKKCKNEDLDDQARRLLQERRLVRERLSQCTSAHDVPWFVVVVEYVLA